MGIKIFLTVTYGTSKRQQNLERFTTVALNKY